MSKSRILILHSFNNKGYQERLQQIANNPFLDGIVFQHCCIIDRDRSSAHIRHIEFLMGFRQFNSDRWNEEYNNSLRKLVEAEVGPLLDQQITDFKPEVVIIHGGTIFEAVPGACITMVMELMEKHPGPPFALQGKQEWLYRQFGKAFQPFEQRWANNQMRWVRENFIDDEEVQHIIDAIF